MERQVKELQLRIVDLEAVATADPSRGLKRLETRVEDLTTQLDRTSREKDEIATTARRTDRSIRELQFQVTEKEKLRIRADEDLTKAHDKIKKLKQDILDLVRPNDHFVC
jgi:hypothetical protein